MTITCSPSSGAPPALLSPARVSLMGSGMSKEMSFAGKSSPMREAGVAGLTVDRLVLRPVSEGVRPLRPVRVSISS